MSDEETVMELTGREQMMVDAALSHRNDALLRGHDEPLPFHLSMWWPRASGADRMREVLRLLESGCHLSKYGFGIVRARRPASNEARFQTDVQAPAFTLEDGLAELEAELARCSITTRMVGACVLRCVWGRETMGTIPWELVTTTFVETVEDGDVFEDSTHHTFVVGTDRKDQRAIQKALQRDDRVDRILARARSISSQT